MEAAAVTPRVLFIGDHFGYANGVVHGVTTYYLSVLPRLQDAGVEVGCCILGEPHPAAKELAVRGILVGFLGASKWNPFLADRIELIARKMQANVLHVASMKAVVLGRIVARRLGAKLLIHSHDMNLPPAPVRLLYRLLKSYGERGLAVSSAAANNMGAAYSVDRADVTILSNAIDLETIRAMAPGELPAGLPESSPRIAWAGRLHHVKGPDRMLRAMARLVAVMPQVQLVMAGDGPERVACEQLIEKLGLAGNVRLLGQRADLTRILKHVDLLCITSRNEGFSLVAAEAGAAGVPVVAYAVGGLTDVVADGRTGMLVPDGDEVQFVATLEKLLADAGLRARLSDEASRYVERFSMQAHIDKLVGEYHRAVKPRAG